SWLARGTSWSFLSSSVGSSPGPVSCCWSLAGAISRPTRLRIRPWREPEWDVHRTIMGRIVLFHGRDRPLELARFPVPQPRGAELLVRVVGCTLCSSDLHTQAGRRPAPTPTVLGHEVVGRIEAFGREAPPHDFRGKALTVGDRVSWSVAAGCGR